MKTSLFNNKSGKLGIQARLITAGTEDERLSEARLLIKNRPGSWTFGCYSEGNELVLIMARDPSVFWSMTFGEAKQIANQTRFKI